MFFSALWAYRTSTKTTIGFTPFQLVYGLEATLPIECEIPSSKLPIELLPDTSPKEERLQYLKRLDETRRIATMVIEAQNKHVKAHFDQTISPRTFAEGDLVLLYDQEYEVIGTGNLSHYVMAPILSKEFLLRVSTSWQITMDFRWRSLETGCILNVTMLG